MNKFLRKSSCMSFFHSDTKLYIPVEHYFVLVVSCDGIQHTEGDLCNGGCFVGSLVGCSSILHSIWRHCHKAPLSLLILKILSLCGSWIFKRMWTLEVHF
jgi:hypothetical protein